MFTCYRGDGIYLAQDAETSVTVVRGDPACA
jgi:hypothetical protein